VTRRRLCSPARWGRGRCTCWGRRSRTSALQRGSGSRWSVQRRAARISVQAAGAPFRNLYAQLSSRPTSLKPRSRRDVGLPLTVRLRETCARTRAWEHRHRLWLQDERLHPVLSDMHARRRSALDPEFTHHAIHLALDQLLVDVCTEQVPRAPGKDGGGGRKEVL
jgi:hypothetical protein